MGVIGRDGGVMECVFRCSACIVILCIADVESATGGTS